MARDDKEIRIQRRGDRASPAAPVSSEPSLGELFKRLTADTTELIRQEMALAKVEMREVGTTLARDAAKFGLAAGFALAGVLALGAFAVITLGGAIDSYWLAALIVGGLLLAVGAGLARSAMNDIKQRGLKPQETVQSLRDDASWAKQEGRELKRELTR
jgi:uncharacterized membrane protein YqjE